MFLLFIFMLHHRDSRTYTSTESFTRHRPIWIALIHLILWHLISIFIFKRILISALLELYAQFEPISVWLIGFLCYFTACVLYTRCSIIFGVKVERRIQVAFSDLWFYNEVFLWCVVGPPRLMFLCLVVSRWLCVGLCNVWWSFEEVLKFFIIIWGFQFSVWTVFTRSSKLKKTVPAISILPVKL